MTETLPNGWTLDPNPEHASPAPFSDCCDVCQDETPFDSLVQFFQVANPDGHAGYVTACGPEHAREAALALPGALRGR